jgi:hypothetical protein
MLNKIVNIVFNTIIFILALFGIFFTVNALFTNFNDKEDDIQYCFYQIDHEY